MREKNEKNIRETEAALAFSVLLMNILIFLVLGGVVWMMHSAITESSALNAILRGGYLP